MASRMMAAMAAVLLLLLLLAMAVDRMEAKAVIDSSDHISSFHGAAKARGGDDGGLQLQLQGFHSSRNVVASAAQQRRRGRRLDETTSNIGYGALTADLVACEATGASYYDCDAAATAANAYTTSCTVITTCEHSTD